MPTTTGCGGSHRARARCCGYWRRGATTPRPRGGWWSGCRLRGGGRNAAAIAGELVIGLPAVEKHIGNVFMKLDLPADLDSNRRVLAVLAYLQRGGEG